MTDPSVFYVVEPDIPAGMTIVQLSALVDSALEPLDTTQHDQALRDQGLAPAESVAAVSDMLATRLTARRS